MEGGAYAVLFNLDPRGKVETTLVLGMKTKAFYVDHPNFVCFRLRWRAFGVEKIVFLHGPFWGSLFYRSIAVLYVVTQRNAMVLPTVLLWLRDDTKNGCEADYSTGYCRYSSQPETIWIGLSTEETEECWALLTSLFSQP